MSTIIQGYPKDLRDNGTQGYSIFVCIFRGQDEEDQFTEIVRNMVSVTDLTVPAKKKVYGKNNGVSNKEAVRMVCDGEVSIAVVSDDDCFEELLVNFDTVSLTIGRQRITARVKVKGEDVSGRELCVENLCQTLNMTLLPLFYSWNPEIIILKINREILGSETEYCIHQLQTFAQGRMILNQDH